MSMEGSSSAGTSLPSVTSSPVPPTPPSTGDNGEGVTAVPGNNTIPPPPPGATQPNTTSLAGRTASTATPTNNVNGQERLIKDFTDQAEKSRELKAQVSFVASIPTLIDQLEHPEQVPRDSPFFILVNIDGKLVKIIPPDASLINDKEKYKAYKTKLLDQLNAITRQYEGSEGRALGEKALAADAKLQASREALAAASINEPPLPKTPIMFTFSSLIKATPSTQPAQPVPAGSETEEGEFMLYPEPPPPPGVPGTPPGASPLTVPPGVPDPQNHLRKRPSATPPKPVAPNQVSAEICPSGQGLRKVQAMYLKPHTGNQFANIFQGPGDPPAPGKLASVNSGHPDLGVGHGGINAEFSHQIDRAALYKRLHEHMVNSASPDSEFVTFDAGNLPAGNTILKGAAMYRPKNATDNTGTIFFDVFNNPPGGDENNAAMMYAVAPDGTSRTYPDTEEGKRQWLLDIKDFSANMLIVQNEWNIHARKNGLPVVPVLRTPMVGGSIFLHPQADKNEVAAAIQTGFDEALANTQDVTISHIQYEETAEQHFRKVVRAKGPKED